MKNTFPESSLLRILNTLFLAGILAMLVLILLQIREPLQIQEPVQIQEPIATGRQARISGRDLPSDRPQAKASNPENQREATPECFYRCDSVLLERALA